jgi:asparagine synthase (glutamine-hydrolysing)
MYTFYSRDRRMSNVAHSGGARVLLSGYGSDHYLFGNLGYIPDLVAAGRIIAAAREVAAWSVAGRQSFWKMARKHALQPLLRRRTSVAPLGGAHFPSWLGSAQSPDAALQRMAEQPEPWRRAFATRATREFNTVHAWFERGVYDAEFEMRYPFLSRPLVEYSLRLPVHMRIRPFGRKWVLRQAMAGVLPEMIRTRQAKGGIDSRLVWAMQQERKRIDALLDSPILGDLGLIRPHELRRAVEQTRCGESHNLILLMSALSLETWLAVRDGRWTTIRRAA